jgi:hypothetical protein
MASGELLTCPLSVSGNRLVPQTVRQREVEASSRVTEPPKLAGNATNEDQPELDGWNCHISSP